VSLTKASPRRRIAAGAPLPGVSCAAFEAAEDMCSGRCAEWLERFTLETSRICPDSAQVQYARSFPCRPGRGSGKIRGGWQMSV
jgi:hypothetical protein